jgi:diguanylate cyclase (GGDEF)-like protein
MASMSMGLVWLGEAVRRIGRGILQPANVPALIAIFAVGLLGYLADSQNRQLYRQHVTATMTDALSVIRSRIEGSLSRDLQIGRGIAASLASHPDMPEPTYSDLVRRLVDEGSEIRSIAAAPDMVVSMVYPLRGNEASLGLDYAKSTSQREAAFRVKETGKEVLAGPLNLVQGGVGLVARFPVIVNQRDGAPRFWGVISTVVDVYKLYARTGLDDPDLPIDVAIRGRDGKGAAGDPFYGDPHIFERNPLRSEINLPGGVWEIAAEPKGGWAAAEANVNITFFRLLILGVGFLVVVPILVTGHLYADRQRRSAEMARLSNRFELALETSHIGVWELDIATRRLTWDDRMYELYHVPRGQELFENSWSSLLLDDDRKEAVEDCERAIRHGGRYKSTFRIVLPNGSTRSIRAVGQVSQTPEGPSLLGLNWDVTDDARLQEELKRAKSLADARNDQLETANARIEHSSLHDALTDLANRRYLTKHLERLRRDGIAEGKGVAVLHLDLDRFKQVNDTFGHAAGDLLLQRAAELMRSVFRPSDFVARIGGDEFVAVCVAADPDELARTLSADLLTKFRQPLEIGGNRCRTAVSIGIACAANGRGDLHKLLIDADIALYRAKERGRNRYEFFTEAIEAEAVRSKKTADEILTAIDENQFTAYYQPQYDAATLAFAGVEALVRWHHPRDGLVVPAHFLGVATDINALPTIDQIVLETALADRLRWIEAGLRVPKVAVNVSVNRLRDESLSEILEAMIIEPGTLAFELTEAIYLDESDETVTANIRRFQKLGIDIEIDDFGTGFASIVSLTRLQPDRLKIARELTEAVATSRPQRQMVRSIVDIGRSLGIGVIAEGVETTEQAEILRDLGCDTLQGYAFARPMAGSALVDYILGDRARHGMPGARFHA